MHQAIFNPICKNKNFAKPEITPQASIGHFTLLAKNQYNGK